MVKRRRRPRRCTVARIALPCGWKMGGRLPKCYGAVMARRASPNDLCMVNALCLPGTGTVARFAQRSGIDMGWAFSLRGHAIMALCAVTGYAGMIKRGACKTRGIVATVTLCGSRNVRWRLPHRGDAVVTRRTHAEHLSVIHAQRRPRRRVMARFARVGAGNMSC